MRKKFSKANILAPDGEEFLATMLINESLSGDLTTHFVLKIRDGVKIARLEQFLETAERWPEFRVNHEKGTFTFERMPEDAWMLMAEMMEGGVIEKRQQRDHIRFFLMRWNPAVSSFTPAAYDDAARSCYSEFAGDWSIYFYDEAERGDRYFMLREGDGQAPGIYWCGEFISNPYEGEDWAGEGRKRRYVDMTFSGCCPLEQGPWIPLEVLELHVPEINWQRGHSGEPLTFEQAKTLCELWQHYYDEKHDEMFAFIPDEMRPDYDDEDFDDDEDYDDEDL